MDYIIRPLQKLDAPEASLLDQKWFGENGITSSQLEVLITEDPDVGLAVMLGNSLVGFCTLEILENKLPSDYQGNVPFKGKALFIQQFTTNTNYKIENMKTDEVLLQAIESKALELGCNEVWEALSIDHPFRKENNEKFDAYGFYERRGYYASKDNILIWTPDSKTKISCFLFRKKLAINKAVPNLLDGGEQIDPRKLLNLIHLQEGSNFVYNGE